MLRIKQLLNNNQKLCFVAKANCYGLGSKILCRYVDDVVDYFAVSSAYEFFKIKKLVSKPILILDPIYENITNLAKEGARFTVCSKESFNKIVILNLLQNLQRLSLLFINNMCGRCQIGRASCRERVSLCV